MAFAPDRIARVNEILKREIAAILEKENITRENTLISITDNLDKYLQRVLQMEAVACKDWLTNKVDRSVTGKIARQQGYGLPRRAYRWSA